MAEYSKREREAKLPSTLLVLAIRARDIRHSVPSEIGMQKKGEVCEKKLHGTALPVESKYRERICCLPFRVENLSTTAHTFDKQYILLTE